MHDDITVAFRSLITDGIIDPGEFGVVLGFGIPPEIAAMIGGAQPRAPALRLTLLIGLSRIRQGPG